MAFPKMPIKDPDDRKDYGVRWAGPTLTPGAADAWLSSGETISESVWLLPDGIYEDIALGHDHDDTRAWIFLVSGEAGTNYTITNRITTSDGRMEDQSLIIPVKER